MSGLFTPVDSLDEERLIEEEEELRKISPSEGAFGLNASDYRHMFDMFRRLFEDAATIRANPNAFIGPLGFYNDKVINAYAKLMSLAMKGMTELNKMRNSDRLTSHILEEHAKALSQAASVELGMELKSLIEAIETGEENDELVLRIRKLMYRRLPEIFLRSATDTLTSAKEDFGLLN